MEFVKRSQVSQASADGAVREVVEEMLDRIRKLGEPAVAEYARNLDDWHGDFVLTQDKKASLIAEVSEQEKDDIRFSHSQVERFAQAQKASLREFEIETEPGVRLGQRIVPVECAGCYVPGGRYAHVASAIMSITTARVAGVPFVVAASPPRNGSISPQMTYAMDLAGADMILENQPFRRILGQKYPYFFIDEAQDTFPEIVDAINTLCADKGLPIVGYFGDPMQQIYDNRMGDFSGPQGSKTITKKENFRSAPKLNDAMAPFVFKSFSPSLCHAIPSSPL